MVELENSSLRLVSGQGVALLVMDGEITPFAEVPVAFSGPLVGDRISLSGSDGDPMESGAVFEVVGRRWVMQSIDVSESKETNLQKPALSSILYLYVQRSARGYRALA